MLVGSEIPRLWTPPRRELTPETSKGFEVIEFAPLVGVELMPWQKWLLIHALELNEDGTYRFRTVLVLVSRQNGKTTLLMVLALWRLLVDGARLVLGTSTNLDYAAEAWEGAVELAKDSEEIVPEFKWPERRTNGQQTLRTLAGARYKIAAATRKGGRSLSVDLGICDELREHHSYDAWAAIDGATTARPDPQLWGISNAGENDSIVLNDKRAVAQAMIETGYSTEDDDMALFEWSAEDDCELDDPAQIAQANPALGHTITLRSIRSKMPPKNPPGVYRTEHLCQGVGAIDAAIPLAPWYRSKDEQGTLADVRGRVVACVDVAPDGEHVALVAGAVVGNLVRVEVVAAWDSVDTAEAELDDELKRVNARAHGWYPSGPAIALKPIMASRRAHEITGDDVFAACMGFAEKVKAGRVIHPGDPLLDNHVAGAKKLWIGDRWRYVRRGTGHVDAAYAAAGVVHLLLTLPQLEPMIVSGGRRADADAA